MTDLSGTPAEQWLSIDLRDAVPGDEAWDNFFKRWVSLTAVGLEFQMQAYSEFGKPCRRRLDPTLDPAEPLRRELREAYRMLAKLTSGDGLSNSDCRTCNKWLSRNAAFGAGKGGE